MTEPTLISGLQSHRRSAWRSILTRIVRDRYLLIMVSIPLAHFIIFKYLPIYGVIIAFKDFNVMRGIWGSEWVGLEYFAKFIDDQFFWRSVKNAMILSILTIVVGMPPPIILALLLNELRIISFKRVVQTVSYLPHFISTVVVVGMIVNFLASDGVINDLIAAFGGSRIQFTSRPEWFRTVFIASDIWQNVGWGTIIYLAAISGVNPELYEAATIDGANRLQQARHITIPSIAPVIVILLILQVGRLLTVSFEKVLLLYNPSVYETADVIQTYVYRRGLLGAQFSYATAVGLFQSVIGLVLLSFANWISRRVSETSLW